MVVFPERDTEKRAYQSSVRVAIQGERARTGSDGEHSSSVDKRSSTLGIRLFTMYERVPPLTERTLTMDDRLVILNKR